MRTEMCKLLIRMDFVHVTAKVWKPAEGNSLHLRHLIPFENHALIWSDSEASLVRDSQ